MYKKGIYTSAVQYLESAAAKDNNPIVSYHLAMALLRGGNEQRGRQLLQAALKISPGIPEAQMAQNVLTEISKVGGK
jgi:predicted Zn-dependent protease